MEIQGIPQQPSPYRHQKINSKHLHTKEISDAQKVVLTPSVQILASLLGVLPDNKLEIHHLLDSFKELNSEIKALVRADMTNAKKLVLFKAILSEDAMKEFWPFTLSKTLEIAKDSSDVVVERILLFLAENIEQFNELTLRSLFQDLYAKRLWIRERNEKLLDLLLEKIKEKLDLFDAHLEVFDEAADEAVPRIVHNVNLTEIQDEYFTEDIDQVAEVDLNLKDKHIKHSFRPKVAIFTHYSILLPKKYYNFPFISVYEHPFDHWLETLNKRLKYIFSKGYFKVYIVLPNSDYWTRLKISSEFNKDKLHYVELIETHTFGIGLGVLVQKIIDTIWKSKKPPYIGQSLEPFIDAMQYFVLTSNTKNVKKEFWFEKMLNKLDFKDKIQENYSLLFDFTGKFTFKISEKYEDNFKEMLKKLVLEIERKTHSYSHAIVSFHLKNTEAKKIMRWLNSRFPEITVDLVKSTDVLKKKFGAHVGICLYN